MSAGPAPKPTAIKELAGNPGKRPLNEHEPSVPVPSSSPYAPRYLCKEEQTEWRRAPCLRAAATVSDRPLVGDGDSRHPLSSRWLNGGSGYGDCYSSCRPNPYAGMPNSRRLEPHKGSGKGGRRSSRAAPNCMCYSAYPTQCSTTLAMVL